MTISEEQRRELLNLLALIGQYGNHRNDCSHWDRMTEEYCTCGLSDARAAWKRIHEILGVTG